jgi:hypothetical protein
MALANSSEHNGKKPNHDKKTESHADSRSAQIPQHGDIRLSAPRYWNCYSTLHLADGAEKLAAALSGTPSGMLPDATEKRYM